MSYPPVRKLRLKPPGMDFDPIDVADATNKKKYQIRPQDVLEVESGAIIITRANGARIVFPLRTAPLIQRLEQPEEN